MRFKTASSDQVITVCDFCGMSSAHKENSPQMVYSGQAAICEGCVAISAEIFRKNTQPQTTQTQEVSHG